MPHDRYLRRVRRCLLAAGAPILLFALLPTLLFVGHWSELAGGLTGRQPAAGEEDSEAHATHCHAAFASCADQPAPPGPQGFGVAVELPSYAVFTVPLEGYERALGGRHVQPLVEPPRPLRGIA